MSWTPGPDPYPRGPITDLSGFDYLDELHFVRHAKVHVNKTPRSLWQLAADFRVRMTVYAEGQSPYQVTITAAARSDHRSRLRAPDLSCHCRADRAAS